MQQIDTLVTGGNAAALATFPVPTTSAFIMIAVLGAVGAFAGDLATDGGRLERTKKDDAGWTLGFVGKMFIGAVAALIVLTLNPPGSSWLALVGTSLVAGIGGEAIVLGFVASGRIQSLEQHSDALLTTAKVQLDALRPVAVHSQLRARELVAAGNVTGVDREAYDVVDSKIQTAKDTLDALSRRK